MATTSGDTRKIRVDFTDFLLWVRTTGSAALQTYMNTLTQTDIKSIYVDPANTNKLVVEIIEKPGP